VLLESNPGDSSPTGWLAPGLWLSPLSNRWFGVMAKAWSMLSMLFEAAIRGLYRFDSSVWTEDDVFDRMDITVEVRQEPVTHTVSIE